MEPLPATPEILEPSKPKFPWFSKGVLILLLITWWWLWAVQQPDKPGTKPIPLKTTIEGVVLLVGGAAVWQWIRYADFKQKVKKGTWGQPSFLSKLFAPKPTYVGSKGGRYTVSAKGNKVYKKRR